MTTLVTGGFGDQLDLGPAPRTALDDGGRTTLDAFARLAKENRLDARELA